MSATTEDKYKKFEDEGVTFKAKLIGCELVMEPRGDKMCQNSIQRLKAIIKGQKAHKRRIILKISYSGVKVCDEKTSETLYHHEVPQISFIASDDTDSRTFGYVCDVPNKAHQFICFKTGGPALQVMSEISSLFEAVLVKKKQQKPGGQAEEQQQQQPQQQQQDCASGEITKLDESPFDVLTGDSLSGVGSSGGGRGSTGAGGDSGIMDLTFNDWLSSPQHNAQQSSGSLTAGLNQQQPDDSQPFVPLSQSSPFDTSPAIPIAKSHRPQQLNFTSSSFSSGQSDAHILSKTTPMPSIFNDPDSPFSTAPLAATNTPVNNTTISNRFPSAQNRSLIYNHSSVSLNDAALSHRSPVSQNSSTRYESTDKYAVFNDIDAMPSIFESISSLDSTSKLSNAGQQLHLASQSMDYRQHQQPTAGYLRQQYSTSSSNPTTAINAASNTTSRPFFNQSQPQAGMPPRQLSNPFDDDFFA